MLQRSQCEGTLEEESGYVGYPPVITGWYVLLHNGERIPNNQENSCAVSLCFNKRQSQFLSVLLFL